ncbi:hypothetical protein HHL19_28055 [Streptomyces sp. R302]|uniref:hypothetical protein n=1 Tax=unclassified Streptomyces TaxID=2593676 RepID=UPI00145F0DDE|nr:MULTISPECIES: hypothetical protein [unclassified Streptomyces]NML52129.1 hypothetical protein [Streptomyces sp. R301]NML82405.1 hypothetical protein [Streptomyces sp. R302]
MPQNEHHDPDAEFLGEFGSALRATGEGFPVDSRPELVTGGLARGRRRLLRRRLAVTGGALALAAIGVGGVYAGSVVTPAKQADKASVAGAPEGGGGKAGETAAPDATPTDAVELKPGEAEIPLSEIADVLKAHTPAGKWRFDSLEGTGQGVGGYFDDGEGEAAVGVFLSRAGRAPDAGADMVTCPSKAYVPYDDCDEGRLRDGSRWMVFQGYEYPDKREETKNWRATLLTKDGFLVDVSEYNAPAEKGAAISRENPPFTAAQLKTLVAAEAWRPLLKQIPPLPTAPARPGKAGKPGEVRQAPPQITGGVVTNTLRALLPQGLKVVDKGGEGEFGFLVVDDGKGKSLVQINVQYGMGDVAGQLYGSGDVTTLPDGRKVKLTQQPGEKGGEGVVWWTADTMTKDGFRVVVSAFNTGAQHEAATRAEPALTMEQLKKIALDPKWAKLPAK